MFGVSPSAPKLSRKPQTNLYLHRQLVQREWDTLFDKHQPFGSKVLTLCRRKERLGDVWSTEHSDVHVVAILTVANQSDVGSESIDIQPASALQTLATVKSNMKVLRKNKMPHYGNQGLARVSVFLIFGAGSLLEG